MVVDGKAVFPKSRAQRSRCRESRRPARGCRACVVDAQLHRGCVCGARTDGASPDRTAVRMHQPALTEDANQIWPPRMTMHRAGTWSVAAGYPLQAFGVGTYAQVAWLSRRGRQHHVEGIGIVQRNCRVDYLHTQMAIHVHNRLSWSIEPGPRWALFLGKSHVQRAHACTGPLRKRVEPCIES